MGVAEARELAARFGVEPHPDHWAPHRGPQEAFLRLTCFEALYGGSAGGGKSDALLADALRGVGKGYGRAYNAGLFRRTYPELKDSLIRRAFELYPLVGGRYHKTDHVWTFPDGETILFRALEHEQSALDFKSAAFQYLGFDELTSFLESQYTYLFSRVRSAHGVPCRVRAASNPGGVGHQWVRRRFFDWVSRKSTRPARSGEVRYFVRRAEQDVEVRGDAAGALGRTFVRAKLEDNPTLEAADPGYRARLAALPALERARLVGGDWDAEPAKRDFYDHARVRRLAAPPPADEVLARARAWDFGGTPGGDPSVGLRASWTTGGLFVVEHVLRFQSAPDGLHANFGVVAAADLAFDERTGQVIPEDPGAAGKLAVADFLRRYPAIPIGTSRPSKDKVTRFKPVSSRALAGHFAVVDDGSWDVAAYAAELEAFPAGTFDDQVDATSDAYAAVARPEGDDDARSSRGGKRR